MALVLLVSAADHAGLARSSRGGSNVTALAIATLDPHTIYVGTASGGLFKSTDSGMSWRRADAGLPRRPVGALDVDPENSNTVYAGVARAAVLKSQPDLFKSVDGGKSWGQIRSPNLYVGIVSVAVDPKRPATIYAGTDAGCSACDLTGLFKTRDGGRSWKPSSAYLEGSASLVVIDPSNAQHLYAKLDGGLEASENGGKAWRLTFRQPHGVVYALALDPRSPQALYIGTDDGVVKTEDAGHSWQRANNGLPKGPTASALAIEPDRRHAILAAVSSTTRNGVFRSTDGGHTWKQLPWHVR